MPRATVKRALPAASSIRAYRELTRSSKCKAKPAGACCKTKGCKYVRGKKRRYCRKSKNTMRRRKSVSS